MPKPNVRGGKSYKKAKGGSNESDAAAIFLTKEDDQMVGRIVRMLGDLNVSVFCQDNKTRICKIAMGIKKKVRFFAGDVVLVSLRDCLVSKADLEAGKRSDRGDVLGKYNEAQYNQLKADGIPNYVFAQTDTLVKIAAKFDEGDMKGALALGEDAVENYEFGEGGDTEEENVTANTMVTQPGSFTVTNKNNKDEDKDIDLDTL
jgi:initiation factor 1A